MFIQILQSSLLPLLEESCCSILNENESLSYLSTKKKCSTSVQYSDQDLVKRGTFVILRPYLEGSSTMGPHWLSARKDNGLIVSPLVAQVVVLKQLKWHLHRFRLCTTSITHTHRQALLSLLVGWTNGWLDGWRKQIITFADTSSRFNWRMFETWLESVQVEGASVVQWQEHQQQQKYDEHIVGCACWILSMVDILPQLNRTAMMSY